MLSLARIKPLVQVERRNIEERNLTYLAINKSQFQCLHTKMEMKKNLLSDANT